MMVQLFLALQHILVTCSSNDSTAFVQPYSIYSIHVQSTDSSAFLWPYSLYSLPVHQMIVHLLFSLTAYTRYMFIKWWFIFCVDLQHILVTCSSNDRSAFVKHYSIYSLNLHHMIVQLLCCLTAYTRYMFIKW